MSLSAWGWNDDFARLGHTSPARVTSEARGFCRIQTESGDRTAATRCDPPPVTGDWVVWDNTGITGVLERRTKISRRKAGRETAEQVLAANVDVLFIVTALDGDFNLRRLERYLIVARQGGVEPLIVLNKADLCPDPLAGLRQVDELVRGLVPVVLTSALDDASTAQLHRYMEPGQTAALVGSSGVGKSTLVNRLLGQQAQPTAAVRESDSRGRHTTSARQLFLLDAGWLLMDTPGLREVEPWGPPEAVDGVFEDIAGFATLCRFRDCRHQDEPDCGVRAAAGQGELPPGRLDSYLKLRGELERLERMRDLSATLEEKRKWKAIHRAMRRMPDKRR
ncbi:MAG: ribosome small subunit-dependent GTPase A [Bryobacteraceae bacterium]|nr:ribosome small subunit-dependent GTPase A [Bryobacteraceae bacterium]